MREVAVLMPVYRGSATLRETLESVRKQTLQQFTVYINDDTPATDSVEQSKIHKIVSNFEDTLKISFHRNEHNLGYPRNLQRLAERSTEELIFLCAQDDILSPIAIESCVESLNLHTRALAVSRPYYWFQNELNQPVRRIGKLRGSTPRLVTPSSDWASIKRVLVAASQLSGLMYRRSGINEPFADSIFPAHIYPMAGALRDGGVVYLPHSTVAVSINSSQTRTISTIYEESPSSAWTEMYKKIFSGDEFRRIRVQGIRDHVGKNFVGLIQIRCYGSYRFFLRELLVMFRARWINLIDPRFFGSAIALGLLPRRLLIYITDNFKSRVVGRFVRHEHLAGDRDKWWR